MGELYGVICGTLNADAFLTYVTHAAVERFGAMLRAEIMGENADLRRSYVRMLVGNVSVNDNDIIFTGSTAVLEAAATAGGMKAGSAVRGFDRKWCRLQDSNL